MLTPAQKTTLKAALHAEPDAGVQTALAIRDDMSLYTWVNSLSTTDAWRASMSKRDLFEATNITQFDTISAGKRDVWLLMLDNTPIDFRRNKMRSSIEDVWGQVNSVPILQSCIDKATRGQIYLGGTSRTTNAVTALDRNYAESISLTEVSESLNLP